MLLMKCTVQEKEGKNSWTYAFLLLCCSLFPFSSDWLVYPEAERLKTQTYQLMSKVRVCLIRNLQYRNRRTIGLECPRMA
jgi:uncharacterized membrane protein